MPVLGRPDGAHIHYEVRGDGPLVVLALGFAALPQAYEAMIADLASDHRVATWDPRGCGRSDRKPPFSFGTDAEDLAALIGELGPEAKVFGAGHGVNTAAFASVRHGAAITGLVAHGITTAMFDDLTETEGIASSRSVIELLVQQMRSDPKGASRTMLASLNPQLDEEGLRERVDQTLEYIDVEATLERLDDWMGDGSALDELRQMGDRVFVLEHESDWWQAGTIDTIAELLPEAKIRSLDDGPLSRPDLAAALVREMP